MHGLPSYGALLRQGVSPSDPHLLAPAAEARPGRSPGVEADLIVSVQATSASPRKPPRLPRAPTLPLPSPPEEAALAPSAELELGAAVDRLRGDLKGLAEQMAALRGWQAAAGALTALETRCAAHDSQLGELTTCEAGGKGRLPALRA